VRLIIVAEFCASGAAMEEEVVYCIGMLRPSSLGTLEPRIRHLVLGTLTAAT
jgi:hypothetical protein